VSIADRDVRLVFREGEGGKDAERQGGRDKTERIGQGLGSENGGLKRENGEQEVPEMLRLI